MSVKACPFCAGEAHTARIGGEDGILFWVTCNACGAQSDQYPTRVEAHQAWNLRRNPPDAPVN